MACLHFSQPISCFVAPPLAPHPLLVPAVVLPLLALLHLLLFVPVTAAVQAPVAVTPAASRLEPVVLEAPLSERLGLDGSVVNEVEALLLEHGLNMGDGVRAAGGGVQAAIETAEI